VRRVRWRDRSDVPAQARVSHRRNSRHADKRGGSRHDAGKGGKAWGEAISQEGRRNGSGPAARFQPAVVQPCLRSPLRGSVGLSAGAAGSAGPVCSRFCSAPRPRSRWRARPIAANAKPDAVLAVDRQGQPRPRRGCI